MSVAGKMSLIKWLDLPLLGDERGGLISLEALDIVPFEIKRVYYLYKTKKSVSRGYHAHRNLKQVAVCVSGNCKMILDNGDNREEASLDSPEKGILIESMVWREMHDFSDDCVLVVIASELYEEADYIRNYESFLIEAGYRHEKE